MEIHHLRLLLLHLGLKSVFHSWVCGALIITDKHKPPLTTPSPCFNITLIFHLWLLIQSLITNKHSVNVAIIASSPRLDYLWHPGFTITATGKRASEGVSVDCTVWETQIFLFQQNQSEVQCVCECMLAHFACRVTLVINAAVNAASHHNVNRK